MRTPLNIDDFESYLEQEVNQHRMYPSDYVWRNIQHDLHGYKKWPALTVITLFVISALVVGTLLIKPKQQAAVNTPGAVSQTVTDAGAKTGRAAENQPQHFSPEHIAQQTPALGPTGDIDITSAFQDAFNTFHGVTELRPGSDLNGAAIVNDAPMAINTSAGTNVPNTIDASAAKVVADAASGVNRAAIVVSPLSSPVNSANTGVTKNGKVWAADNGNFGWMKSGAFDNQAPDRFYYTKGVWKALYGTIFYLSADRLPSSSGPDLTLMNNMEKKFTYQTARNTFKAQPKSSRFDVQAYITPSVSYRILSHTGSKANVYLPGTANNGAGYVVDLNSFLHNNQSATGYEAGAAIGYKLSSTITLRTGLQFNYRQYNVQGAGAAPATGTPGQVANNINNNNVAASADLSMQSAQGKQQPANVITNAYYQVALPVGVDWKAWGSGKFSWNIAASIQPTYTLYKAPFVVATSDNGYADGAALMRNWNINTSLATYVSYTTGKFKWQLGPQAGYQLLSTLKGSYPVTEHLLNYGIKIGFVRSLP